MLEPVRVAGREADQVLIQPRDDLRFGYRLFIDRASALPLQSVMFDMQQRIISQMMFVDLRIGHAITPIEHDLSAMQVAKADPSDGVPPERLTPPAWSFSDLPPGFQLNVHRRRFTASAGGRDHFVFSDGLATVSVYVQPKTGDGGLKGVSQLGAASAVGRPLGEHEVVVVGEVPVKTLDWFARQIRPTAP
jgi:sigma-E factor negative regulatory protein RseB